MKAAAESKPLQTRSCLEVKAGHDGQLLHGQLLGRLLVTMAAAAFDFSAAAEVLRSGEPGGGEESVSAVGSNGFTGNRDYFSGATRMYVASCLVLLWSHEAKRERIKTWRRMWFTCADSR